jgi:hypothetical protein
VRITSLEFDRLLISLIGSNRLYGLGQDAIITIKYRALQVDLLQVAARGMDNVKSLVRSAKVNFDINYCGKYLK